MDAIDTNKQVITITAPDKCPGCGLEHDKAVEEGYEDGFLMFDIPTAGISHFVCPRCFCVMMNKECFDTQRAIRKEQKSRIIKVV